MADTTHKPGKKIELEIGDTDFMFMVDLNDYHELAESVVSARGGMCNTGYNVITRCVAPAQLDAITEHLEGGLVPDIMGLLVEEFKTTAKVTVKKPKPATKA